MNIKIILSILVVLFVLPLVSAVALDNSDNQPEMKMTCDSNMYNCNNFTSQEESQKVMEVCGNNDIHYLDGDNDGIACELLNNEKGNIPQVMTQNQTQTMSQIQNQYQNQTGVTLQFKKWLLMEKLNL